MDPEENGTPDPEEQEDKQSELEQKFADQQKRAEKAEQELKELKEALASATEEEPVLEEKEEPSQFDTLADNLSVLKPLETDEVEELRTQAKDLGVDPIKFAQSPAWKAHLDSLRTNKKAEGKTPEPSFRTAVFEGKSYQEIIEDPESPKETRQAAFEAQRDALLDRGRNQII